MSLKFNSDQQRIEASGVTPTGRWTNATYSRSASGLVNIVSVGHGIIGTEKLYIDFLSGGETDGTYTVTKVDDDNLSFQSTSTGIITAGETLAYKRVRSLSIQGEESLELSVGVGALEKDAIYIDKNAQENVRVGINTTSPEFELDVEGQIRTTRSIISDTAQVNNLDIGVIINPALDLRGPNLINYEDTDVTSSTFGTTFYPTADTPPLSDQSRRVATTDFVYKVATNDTGGRVYVSETIGSDANDGRSAARPVATIKKAAQIAYGLQKATPDPTDEYVSIIVSGGEYFEDNPISLPRNCSLIGDNLRRVIVRPQNQDRHMIKASNETYINGVVFRDALQNPSDPQSTTIHTWKYAFVFDDKQRLYYEPELGQVPAEPGDKFRGENIFKVTFNNHTGTNLTLLVNGYVQGGTSGTQGRVQSVNFTGPQASPYSTGDVTILVTSGDTDVFQDAEKLFYNNTSFASIVTDLNNNPSDRFDVIDAESLRPELETISNQIYQHTFDSERETLLFGGDASQVGVSTDQITIVGHRLVTGQIAYYEKFEDSAAIPGLIDTTSYYVRRIDDDTIELYDTYANATASVGNQGRRDLTGIRPAGNYHRLTTGNVMPETNNIRIKRHQFATGDSIIYRAGKMGAIAPLIDGTTYFVYVENTDWIRIAATAANAVQKAANGSDNPITIDLTSTGTGFQRIELATKLLNITTIDTDLTTQSTYNGPIFNLATSSASSDFHDYEVGQEIHLYGFQNSSINFGGSVNSSYVINNGLITVTLSSVDNALTTALFSNWISLGEGGLTFSFPGEDDRYSKTYHIGQFDLGSGIPSLPSNTDLGMGYARYNSSSTTATFVLKQSDSPTTGDNITSSSGSNVSILDNLADLNGKKYITHRIERADGYSLQFVVRGNITNIGSGINPSGDQTVISSSNYVLASLRNSPYGFSKVNISDRFRDGANAIQSNQEFIAEESYAYVKSHYENSQTRTSALTIGSTTFSALGERVDRPITSWSVSGNQATFVIKRGHNLFSSDGGTATTVTIATSGNATVNGTHTIADIIDDRRFVLTLGSTSADGQTGSAGTFNDFRKPFRTPGSEPYADRYADAADNIYANAELIAEEAVGRMLAANSGFTIPTGNQSCIDDAKDFLQLALAHNLRWGGNDRVYDAANYYIRGAHVAGEQDRSVEVFNHCRDMAIQAMRNETITTSHTSITQYTHTVTVDTASPACQDVAASITTFTTILTNAIGTNSGTGNLNGVIRTVAPGDMQCIDDVQKILRAFQHDLRYGGNSKTIEAANLYISGSNVAHVPEEVEYTRATFAAAKELAIDAIRNQLEDGQFSQIDPVSNGSITVDSSSPECANVVSALTSVWGILDNVLSSATAYSGTVTQPDPVMVEQNSSKYSFPLLSNNLDLPVIEASPYIQNSSLISFLGGSGCEIDGNKVATPNVPRPGLKLNAQGQSVAQFDPQGKSMVASAFTIISFGGTAYNILNDGYTQLVSVFAIFCQDGILVQSGGYASVTNSASNFGTFSLRATGFRSEPYTFDVGTIDSITDELDGNSVVTGRQIIRVSGTNLTNVPVEDYIIRIGGVSPTNPAVEHIILETNVISGSQGSQIVAEITTNIAMDFSDGSNRYQSNSSPTFVAGSLPLSNLVGNAIQFHRPSICNSSSHTWEYSGSGNTYAALPQNGGFGLGTAFEAAEQSFGQVYTSGTNEFGDFKVGNFVTIFNRTGAISFVGTVSISELSSIKIVGGAITITGFSDDDNLGGTFASDALLPTQASVRDYISNNLGPYLNQPYSTNAVPSALVQLTSSGKINIDQIPALRPFNITSVASQAERLAIEDANAGDIAIETSATTFNVAPSSVNTSANTITIISHGTNTGDQLNYESGSTAIQGISYGNTYYVISVDADTIKLASTESNANAGTAINLQTQGVGTQVFKTQGTAISYILENDLESQFLAFNPSTTNAFSFSNGDIVTGSSTTARGTVTAFNNGLIYNFVISNGGSGYSGDFALTIGAPQQAGGVQAAATAKVTSGVVTSVEITNKGSGYTAQPTVNVLTSPSGASNNAAISAQIEARLDIDIANSIKFDAADFIVDQALANEGTGTYSQSGSTTITVTDNSHGLSNADIVYLDFTSGAAADGFYVISTLNANEYTVTATSSATTSGNFNRKRIIDLTRAINTSATNNANWTQLTSTNIDASNIVAGTIDPERLASKGTANSSTFLRGDSSWELALQSMRPTTSDAMVLSGSDSDSSYVDFITITNGGSGYTDGTYQNIPMGGGNVSISSTDVARATYIVTSGVITSASVTDSGTGYTADFTVTVPSELGGGSGAILQASKGTVNRVFGNIEIDIKKGDANTPSTTVYGNYGVFKFRKDVANQAVGNQNQGGFIVSNNGEVALDQGPGSGLNADLLHGNSLAYFQSASNLTSGTLDPARLANTTYAISISGVADRATKVFNETQATGSNPTPSQATNGIAAHLRDNSATGLSDGGTQHGVVTYRRQATGTATTQLGFTDNNNLYIRGNTGGNNVYSNWAEIWSDANDGAGSGLDADLFEGKQGQWYQSGYNFGDTRSGLHPVGDMFLPEVLGKDKVVFENLYVNDTGNQYTLYIPDFHAKTGPNANLTDGGTAILYSDAGATNNIGTITFASAPNGVVEGTHTSGEIYTIVTGTISFNSGNDNENIYKIGPNPGSKWTVTSSNKISGGSTTIIGLRDDANGAKLQIGKAATSTTPTIDFRSSGQAPVYDVQLIASGGGASNGGGTLRINAGDLTVNGNTVWHAGNDGASSQLDARYLQGAEPATTAAANSIAKRGGSGELVVQQLTSTNGVFTNNTTTLNLGDSGGVTIGKSSTNMLAVKGKGDANTGFIVFGSDTNGFGYNSARLKYDSRLHLGGLTVGHTTGTTLGTFWAGPAVSDVASTTWTNTAATIASVGVDQDDAQTNVLRLMRDGTSGVIYAGRVDFDLFRVNASGVQCNTGLDIRLAGVNTSTMASVMTLEYRGRVGINDTTPSYALDVNGSINAQTSLRSSVATGTAPIIVTSTTECTNLNAAKLQGYTALGLPYLGGSTNLDISSTDGVRRFFFANNSYTVFNTNDNFYFQSGTANKTTMQANGRWAFHGNGDIQNDYRISVQGDSGLNINASEGLSSGQKTTVLRATGDKQWIDSYGVFKRNRQTVGENITVAATDNCMSAGPITINNGTTITIADGGSWSVV